MRLTFHLIACALQHHVAAGSRFMSEERPNIHECIFFPHNKDQNVFSVGSRFISEERQSVFRCVFMERQIFWRFVSEEHFFLRKSFAYYVRRSVREFMSGERQKVFIDSFHLLVCVRQHCMTTGKSFSWKDRKSHFRWSLGQKTPLVFACWYNKTQTHLISSPTYRTYNHTHTAPTATHTKHLGGCS